jgi:hypothetical protein
MRLLLASHLFMFAATFFGTFWWEFRFSRAITPARRPNASGEIDYERSMGGAGCLSVTSGCMDFTQHNWLRSVCFMFRRRRRS